VSAPAGWEWLVGQLPELGAAALSGLVLGIERHRRRSQVGMKTCALICVGATAYMAIGHLILEVSPAGGDPTRMASQIVTGIGFLGAGAILRGAGGVVGLTSAATIWFIGAVGVLIGCGYPLPGLALTVGVVGLIVGIRTLERWLDRRLAPVGETRT
jgi:putative Mg2+ transporter-C (MgtC) family protein